MKINGKDARSIRVTSSQNVEIIDQIQLPHRYATVSLYTVEDAARAIREMWVRGAPLIGVTAAYGVALGLKADPSDAMLERAYTLLLSTRPTAVNLRWALDRTMAAVRSLPESDRCEVAYAFASALAEEDVVTNSALGDHGLTVLEALWLRRQAEGAERLNILTHCNAGWLATVDWGTALAPVYKAFDSGIPVHVWVDETRPRNQGAALTACELGWHGVPHTVIPDNTGGHLMQHGMVDVVIVGADRVTRTGDTCNKIGTYLKALAASDNAVPFYVALPGSTVDWSIRDGLKEIVIETRDPREVTHIRGENSAGDVVAVKLTPKDSAAANYGFDVTPARLVSGFITERGVCAASEKGLLSLFPQEAA